MEKRGIRTSKELKAEAIRLVLDGELSKAAAAKQCGVSYTSLRNWVKAAEALGGAGNDQELVDENRRLAAEVKELKMERDILKKATVFFAKESR